MRQLSPHRWSFEPPDAAPMTEDCRTCRRRVAVLRPRVTDVEVGYVVEGVCAECGGVIELTVP